MEMYIIVKRNPKVNVWGVAFLGRVFTDYHDAVLMLDVYQHQHPNYDAKIVAFDIEKEFN